MTEKTSTKAIESLVEGITTIGELTEISHSVSNKIDNITLKNIKSKECEILIKKSGFRQYPEFAHDTDVGLDMYPMEVELISYSGNSYKIHLSDNVEENKKKIEEAEASERKASPFLVRLTNFFKGEDYRLGWKRAKFNSGVAIEPDIDFFIFESLGFVVVAICMWLYMLIAKKYKYDPFKKKELVRCGAAAGETFGTMTYIFAVAGNPILTAPITSSYCFVTIVLARIFLKERLTKKQYLSLAFLVVGIALLGVSEIINA